MNRAQFAKNLLVVTLFVIAGCKAARYEIVKEPDPTSPPASPIDPGPVNPGDPNQGDPNQVPANTPFTVEGPKTGFVGQPNKFIGKNCNGTVTWIVVNAPTMQQTGMEATFIFDRTDNYTIEATCTETGKTPQKVTVTIKIDPNPTGGQNGQNSQNNQNRQNR